MKKSESGKKTPLLKGGTLVWHQSEKITLCKEKGMGKMQWHETDTKSQTNWRKKGTDPQTRSEQEKAKNFLHLQLPRRRERAEREFMRKMGRKAVCPRRQSTRRAVELLAWQLGTSQPSVTQGSVPTSWGTESPSGTDVCCTPTAFWLG